LSVRKHYSALALGLELGLRLVLRFRVRYVFGQTSQTSGSILETSLYMKSNDRILKTNLNLSRT